MPLHPFDVEAVTRRPSSGCILAWPSRPVTAFAIRLIWRRDGASGVSSPAYPLSASAISDADRQKLETKTAVTAAAHGLQHVRQHRRVDPFDGLRTAQAMSS